jgi:radical SAM protein with 4Fe4S-binding SPASM domain
MNPEKPEVIKEYYLRDSRGLYFFMNPELPGWFTGGSRSFETIKLCDGTRTRGQIVAELEKQFELPKEELDKDLGSLLETLGKTGFLKGVNVELPRYERSLDTLYLHLTRDCTLRCKYCYVEGGNVPKNELTTEEIKNVLDQAKALNRVQMLVAITGGEPMMHPDFWEIADYVKSKGCPMCLATNGTLITEENAVRLKDYFYNIQVSLDGPPEVHDSMRGKGSYGKAVEAMRHLTKAGCSVMISGVVSKHNLDTVYHIVDVAAELGIASIKTGIFLPFGKGADEKCLALTEQEFESYWRKMQQTMQEKLSKGHDVKVVNDISKVSFLQPIYTSTNSCGAAIGALSIDSDGGVYPCQSAHLPKFLMGNIKEQPLEKIWKESEAGRQWCDLTIDKIEDCATCVWRKYCGGGCRMQAYAFAGRLDKPVMFCGFLKEFFPKSVDLYLEYVGKQKAEGKKE